MTAPHHLKTAEEIIRKEKENHHVGHLADHEEGWKCSYLTDPKTCDCDFMQYEDALIEKVAAALAATEERVRGEAKSVDVSFPKYPNMDAEAWFLKGVIAYRQALLAAWPEAGKGEESGV